MYYQTPAMRALSPDLYELGEAEEIGNGDAVAIRKENGMYLTVLADGTDAESSIILDQEKFVLTRNKDVVIADRRHINGKCYAVTTISTDAY